MSRRCRQHRYYVPSLVTLTVDAAHTFYVGEGEWLVHNTCRLRFTKEEFQPEVNQIREKFIGDSFRHNVGIADYNIEGYGSGSLPAISGGVNRNYEGFAEFMTANQVNQVLGQRPFQAPPGNGPVDTEVKILANIARDLQAAGLDNPTGQIYLFTERHMCGSCQTMKSAFEYLYPGITVKTVIGWK